MIFIEKVNFRLTITNRMSEIELLYSILGYIFICILLVLLKYIIYGTDTEENESQIKKQD